MARKFLYIVGGITILVIAVMFALRIWSEELTEFTFVPTAKFAPQAPLAANIYDDPGMWISRPGMGAKDPARWRPQGFKPDAQPLPAAVFFIHPTSYLDKQLWNVPVDEPESRARAELFVRGMASPFNASADLWVPRYRQAAFGAFLTGDRQALQALDVAYGDVLMAFDHFLAHVAPDQPIVLAGHSQGAYHLRRLLRDRVAGKPLAARIAAVYAVGWPVSLEHDLPAMGLPACNAPDQAGCVMSWLSVAEPADTAMLLKGYARKPGLDGKAPGGSPFLCSNPLTGMAGGAAPAAADLGTVVPSDDLKQGRIVTGMVPARCGEDHFLYIGDPPKMGPFVLPGNNYHVYDIPLFWANLRADVARRVQAWKPAAAH